jgi:hypothetical protein
MLLVLCVFILLLTQLFFCNQVIFYRVQYPVRFGQRINEFMYVCVSHPYYTSTITITASLFFSPMIQPLHWLLEMGKR